MIDNYMIRGHAEDPYFNPPEMEECNECEGDKGWWEGDFWKPCDFCDGAGQTIKKAVNLGEDL